MRMKKVRRYIEVVTKEDCPECCGSGLKMQSEYVEYSRKVQVTISVCGCVKAVILR